MLPFSEQPDHQGSMNNWTYHERKILKNQIQYVTACAQKFF